MSVIDPDPGAPLASKCDSIIFSDRSDESELLFYVNISKIAVEMFQNHKARGEQTQIAEGAAILRDGLQFKKEGYEEIQGAPIDQFLPQLA